MMLMLIKDGIELKIKPFWLKISSGSILMLLLFYNIYLLTHTSVNIKGILNKYLKLNYLLLTNNINYKLIIVTYAFWTS